MNFAEIVNKKMKDNGWTQADLCRASGLSDAQVCTICKGKTKDPRLSTLILLSHAFNCSIDEFTPSEVQ